MFLVYRTVRTMALEFEDGRIQEVPVSFANGMIGAMPVFASREEAEAWGEGAEIEEFAEAPPTLKVVE